MTIFYPSFFLFHFFFILSDTKYNVKSIRNVLNKQTSTTTTTTTKLTTKLRITFINISVKVEEARVVSPPVIFSNQHDIRQEVQKRTGEYKEKAKKRRETEERSNV